MATFIIDRNLRHYINLDHAAVLERTSLGVFRVLTATGRLLGEVTRDAIDSYVDPAGHTRDEDRDDREKGNK